MKSVIFYSWQSDLPNATNRGFIQQALENVARAITADKTIEVEAAIDRDTQGVPGAPDIAKTILEKIAAADVVVADVSIIGGTPDDRPTPNPNVLIELGYALCSLGHERVLLVLNTAYGGPELLPFDLKMRRVVTYNMPESASDRAKERKSLEGKLNEAVRAGLTKGHRPSAAVSQAEPAMAELTGPQSKLFLTEPGQTGTRTDEYYRFLLGLHDDRAGRRLTKEIELEFEQCISSALGKTQRIGPVIRGGAMSVFRLGADVQIEEQFALTSKGAIGFITHACIRTNDGPFFVPGFFIRHLAGFLGLAAVFYSRAGCNGAGLLQVDLAVNREAQLFGGLPTRVSPLPGTDLFEPSLRCVSAHVGARADVALRTITCERLQQYIEAIMNDLARPMGSVLSARFSDSIRPILEDVLKTIGPPLAAAIVA
jgi:hypothetical protein